jgi:hypothetical protein
VIAHNKKIMAIATALWDVNAKTVSPISPARLRPLYGS